MNCPNFLIPDPGVTYTQPCRRMLSFCHRILRDHQCILSTYLSLCARTVPENVDSTETIRAIRPTLRASCAWATGVMGSKYRIHREPLHSRAGLLVAVQ